MATQGGAGEIDAARKRLSLAKKWEASAQRQLGEAAQERKRAEADLKKAEKKWEVISVDDEEEEEENSSPQNKRQRRITGGNLSAAPTGGLAAGGNGLLLKYPFDALPSPFNSSRLVQSVTGLTELAGHSLGVVGILNSETTLAALNSTAHTLANGERQTIIRPGDRERLRSGGPLNHALVDFWMSWISRAEARSANSSVHFYPTDFISALISDGPPADLFAPDMNPFDKKFLFLPVNADLHWSLCVVVNPGLIGNNYDDYLAEDEEHAYILMRGCSHFCILCVVPGRPGDASDSGVFICRYAYNLYLMREKRFTWNDIAEDPPFTTLITNGPAFQFNDVDISRIRTEFGLLIDRLAS